jgi:uncharacterized membrane protein YcaP (DUF421 family)
MEKEEIIFTDWHRWLFGPTPGVFMLEVLLRTVFMYLVLLVILRLMGKRMGGQLTISELAVMLTLGAIISLPMQAQEKGVLQGVLVLLCALAFQRGINLLGFESKRAEKLLQGKESLLVKDGVINVKKMQDTKISNQQLFAMLRSRNIYNLGEVERVYLEASGLFSIYKFKDPFPGLPLLPAADEGVLEIQHKRPQLVCERCGQAEKEKTEPSTCSNCQADQFTNAVLSI